MNIISGLDPKYNEKNMWPNIHSSLSPSDSLLESPSVIHQ